MSYTEELDRILELGRKNDLDKVKKILIRVDEKNLPDLMKNGCRTSNGPAIFRSIMSSLCLGDLSEKDEKLRQIIVLQAVDEIILNSSIPNKNANKFIDTLFGNIDQFSDLTLRKLIDKCTEEFEKHHQDKTGCRWLPLLGRLLSEVERRSAFMPYENESVQKGEEVKDFVIADICSLAWDPSQISNICQMFQDIKLSSDQLQEIVCKLCSVLVNLPPQSIPPLVFQMLILVKESSILSQTLVIAVNDYFSSKLSLEDRLEKTNVNMDIESLNIIENNSFEEVQQSEGTVVFHFSQAAKMGHIIAKEIVKIVKAGVHAPELVLSPFSIFLALALTSVKQLKDNILDSLRMAISKSILLEEKRSSNAWLRLNLNKTPDIGDILSQVISQSCKTGGWDLIGQGLVDLGLLLLDQNSFLKHDPKVKAVHNYGSRLLMKVIKKQGESASSVLDPLTNKILVTRQTPQYTEALRIIVAETSTILMERPNVVTELVENLQRLSYPAARRTLSGLLPLVRFSRSLRDSIILVLRKALFSQSVQTRKIATVGVILLLKSFKINTNRYVSQLSQSSGSLSQLAVDVRRGTSTSNEALCTELLGVLRRCLGLQGEVRLTFYQGIMDCITRNPELCENVLELMYGHVLYLWGEEGGRRRWLLDLSKLGRESADGWILEEPIGWFLNCLQMLISRGQQVVSEECEILDKLVKLIEEMASNYGDCEITDLGYDHNDNLDRKTSDGERKVIQLIQLQGILEALMEYTFNHGGDKEERMSSQLLQLVKNHSALSDLVIASNTRKKVKKGEKKEKAGEGKKNGDKEDDKDKNESLEKKEKSSLSFSPPLHCFSWKSLSLMLSSLLLDRLPDHQGALSILRSDAKFCVFLLDSISSKLNQMLPTLSSSGDEGPSSDNLFRYLASIASTLFQHAMISQEQIQSVILHSTKCLLLILKTLLVHFPRRKLQTISVLTDRNPGLASEENLNPVLIPAMKKVMKKLLEYSDLLKKDDEEENVAENLATSVHIFTLLFNEIGDGEGIELVKELIGKFMDQYDIENTIVLKPILGLLFQSVLKIKPNTGLALEISKGLHSLTGDLDTSVEVESSNTPTWLTHNTKDTILPLLLDHFEGILDSSELAIHWVKAHTTVSSKSKNVSLVEAAVCILLAKQTNAASELVKTAFPLGQSMDGVLKLLLKIYTVVGGLTKHFIFRSKQGKSLIGQVKFDRLVYVINNQLTKHVYNLITWIESKQKERDLQAAAVRAVKHKTIDPSIARAKVLRESRYIPNLILKIETLEKDLIKLGKRIGQNLCEGNKVSVSRDFRIKFSEEMMEKLRDEEESDDESDDSRDESRTEKSLLADVTNTQESDHESQVPVSKRPKLGNTKSPKENRRETSLISSKKV